MVSTIKTNHMLVVNAIPSLIDSPVRSEKGFSNTATSITAIKLEIKLYKKASARNCLTNWPLVEPVTLRIPTSFALFADRAVERFIKFTQARMMINKAILPNIYMYLILLRWLNQGIPI